MKKNVFLLLTLAAIISTGCGSDEPDNPKEVKVTSATAEYYLSVTPDVVKFMDITVQYMTDNNPQHLGTFEMKAPQMEFTSPEIKNDVQLSQPARFGIKCTGTQLENVSIDPEGNYTFGITARATIKGYDKEGKEVMLDGPNQDTHEEKIVKGSDVENFLKSIEMSGKYFSRGWFVNADGTLNPGLI